MVSVKYFGELKSMLKKETDSFEVSSVSELIKVLKQTYGKEVSLEAKRSHILVNGENASIYGGYKMKLKDGDVVTFIPVCAGG